MVLILETATATTCNVKEQTGCRSGEYCSVSIANGQCNDCSVILPNTTTCCPTLNEACSNADVPFDFNFIYYYTGADGVCSEGCPKVCVMLAHCLSTEETGANEMHARRCDFLVNGREAVKASHILLLLFGAVLWASDIINVLDQTDMMTIVVPKAPTGDTERKRMHTAIIMLLFRIIFIFRTSLLPAISTAGAIVAILTDEDGNSLSGGAPQHSPVRYATFSWRPAVMITRTRLAHTPSLFASQASLSCSRLSSSASLRIWMTRLE